jgi:CYTH domain-containing protein
MAIEIEHKFLVDKTLWQQVRPEKSVFMKQAYLSVDPAKTIRVRIAADKAFLTIKGIAKGISRQEFEYEIPVSDANQLIDDFTSEAVEKIRHYVTFANKLWEVDEFKGANEGLMVAEIELQSETEGFEKPGWALKDVTSDRKYANSSLSQNPFKNW